MQFDDDSSIENSIQDENEEQCTIRFCDECNNMLYPTCENSQLMYKCRVPKCNFAQPITNRTRESNRVSVREFLKEKYIIIDPEFCFDPSMPRENVKCSKCGCKQACYMISTDMDDTKIQKIYICASEKCKHSWRNEKTDAFEDS